jgi:hypothetical protein
VPASLASSVIWSRAARRLACCLLVGEQVGEQDPAVPARLVVGDLAVFQFMLLGLRAGLPGRTRESEQKWSNHRPE